jgi:hypothetical protein
MERWGGFPDMEKEVPPEEVKISRISDELATTAGLRSTLRHVEKVDFNRLTPESFEKARPGLVLLIESIHSLSESLRSTRRRIGSKNEQQAVLKELSSVVERFEDDLVNFIFFSGDLIQRPAPEGGDMRVAAVADLRNSLNTQRRLLENFPIASRWNVWRIKKIAQKTAMATALMLASGLSDDIAQKAQSSMKAVPEEKPQPVQTEEEAPIMQDITASNIQSPDSISPVIDIKSNSLAPTDGGPLPPEMGGSGKAGKFEKRASFTPKDGGPLRPEMGGSGEAGKFEKGVSLGHVDFKLGNSITDPLWIGEVYDFSGGTLRPVERARVWVDDENLQATVTLSPVKVSAGQKVALLAPINCIPNAPRSLSGPSFTYDVEKNTLTFASAGESVIQYSVISREETLNDSHDGKTERITAPCAQQAIKALDVAKDNDEVEKALAEHLSHFRYVVSDDIQSRVVSPLEQSGLGRLEIISQLQIGDCDVLSEYSAALIEQSGHHAAVATGYLESGGEIDSARAHAKLLISQKEDRGWNAQMFEATAATSRQLVNLRLLPDDIKQLELCVQKVIGARGGQGDYQQEMSHMRTTLAGILDKPEYAMYESSADDVDGTGAIRDLDAIWKQARDKIIQANEHPGSFKDLGLALGVDFAIGILALIALFQARFRAQRRLDRHLKASVWQEFIQLEAFVRSGEGVDDKSQENLHAGLMEKIGAIYEKNPALSGVMSMEQVLKLNKNQKQAALRVLAVTQHFIDEPTGARDFYNGFFRSSAAMAESDLIRARLRLRADGVSLDDAFSSLVALTKNPEFVNRAREENQREYREILKKSVSLVSKMEITSDASSRRKLEHVFAELGLASDHSGGSDSVSKRPPRAGSGPEFFDHVNYEPGMDPRHIDQHAFARTGKLYIKRSMENTRSEAPTHLFNVIIDLETVSNTQIERFAAAVMYGQRHPGTIGISSIVMMAHGRAVERMGGKAIDLLMQDKGTTNIAALLDKIADLSAKHVVGIGDSFGESANSLRGSRQKYLTSGMPVELRAVVPTISGDILVLGGISMFLDHEMSRKAKIFSFNVKSEKTGELKEVPIV